MLLLTSYDYGDIVYLEVFTDCGRGLSRTCLSQATQWRQSTWRTAMSFQTLTIRYVTSLVDRGATGRERYNVHNLRPFSEDRKIGPTLQPPVN